MHRVTIRYKDVTESEALRYASVALREMPERKGMIIFSDNVAVSFSDRSKDTAMVVWKQNL